MGERVSRVIQWMKEESVDVVFVRCPENVRYLTDLYLRSSRRLTGIIITPEGLPFLFLPELDVARAQEVMVSERMLCWKDAEDPFERLAHDFGVLGLGPNVRVGVEKCCLSLLESERLKAMMPGVCLVDAGVLLQEMRAVKTDREVCLIERAVEMAEYALDETLRFLETGERHELEVALWAHRALLDAGAERLAFDVRVLSGPRAALPHGEPTRRMIREGDMVVVDMGAVCEGYCSDITRTFVIGKPSHRYLDMYEAVLEAEERAIDAIEPGVLSSQVDRIARETLVERGYGSDFLHRTGHGVGLGLRESPSLASTDETILEDGMVLAIEPGVYLPGTGGVRIEDMVLVTRDGHRLLSRFKRDPYTWQLGGALHVKADSLD